MQPSWRVMNFIIVKYMLKFEPLSDFDLCDFFHIDKKCNIIMIAKAILVVIKLNFLNSISSSQAT